MKFKRYSIFAFIILVTQFLYTTSLIVNAAGTQLTKVAIEFNTTMGSFVITLNPEKAPLTVANFLRYVDEDYYTDTLFHRTIPRFMIQGGGYDKGMNKKKTYAPIKNESSNGLKNIRGSISMARSSNPDSATSQFFINAVHNASLDSKGKVKGYTVFGKITEGMTVIDKIISTPTKKVNPHKNLPIDEIVILSAKRINHAAEKNIVKKPRADDDFISGEHYITLDRPRATRDKNKIEIVEIFTYGCTHCYEFEPMIKEWSKTQPKDIDFWTLPAIWNKSMAFYAKAFYTAQQLSILEQIHIPLFTAIIVDQQNISSEVGLTKFFEQYGVKKSDFNQVFNSSKVDQQIAYAKQLSRFYNPSGVPEIIVNGKYRINKMRAGSYKNMIKLIDYLIEKERKNKISSP